jgi:multisubunit Na+/H+ antiporter MnhG subunit
MLAIILGLISTLIGVGLIIKFPQLFVRGLLVCLQGGLVLAGVMAIIIGITSIKDKIEERKEKEKEAEEKKEEGK